MATMFYEPFKADETGEMPPPDAIENILPEYKYIFYDPKRQNKRPANNSPKAVGEDTSKEEPLDEEHPDDELDRSHEKAQRPQQPNNASRQSVPRKDDLDAAQMSILEYQMRELDNYREAVQKMGKDILRLRQHTQELEDTNATLRKEINRYDETRQELLATSANELNSIDRDELIIRYVTLKQRVQFQSTELAECREKIKQLRAQVVEESDKDKEYDELKKAHLEQSLALRKLQERAGRTKKLEEACKQQEKVIEKMEKVLNSKKFNTKDASGALKEENQRLRHELHQLQLKDEDRLGLYEQIERAESRIASLERALAESSRAWARERQDLQTRLQEAQHGLSERYDPHYRDYSQKKLFDDPILERRFRSQKLAPIHK